MGCREFSVNFTRLFAAHPYTEKVVCADTDPDKALEFHKLFGIDYYTSLDEMLNTNINAVAIFTPRHTHGPPVIQALKVGRRTYGCS